MFSLKQNCYCFVFKDQNVVLIRHSCYNERRTYCNEYYKVIKTVSKHMSKLTLSLEKIVEKYKTLLPVAKQKTAS